MPHHAGVVALVGPDDAPIACQLAAYEWVQLGVCWRQERQAACFGVGSERPDVVARREDAAIGLSPGFARTISFGDRFVQHGKQVGGSAAFALDGDDQHQRVHDADLIARRLESGPRAQVQGLRLVQPHIGGRTLAFDQPQARPQGRIGLRRLACQAQGPCWIALAQGPGQWHGHGRGLGRIAGLQLGQLFVRGKQFVRRLLSHVGHPFPLGPMLVRRVARNKACTLK